jgi:protein-tyrosine phosphatase
MYGPARAELSRHGYDGSAHRARQIEPSWLAACDLMVAMDRHNLAALRAMAPDPETAGRIRLMRSFDPALTARDPYRGEVPDPFGGTDEEVALAFGLIDAAAKGLARQLAGFLGTQSAGR